jgi:hypothetical protein
MPRRRPKALRDERWKPRKHVPVRRIHGVSAQTRAAVRRVEDDLRWGPDLVFGALARFEWTFRQPGRYLNLSATVDPGLEVEDARDDLEEVLRRLPAGARKDLGRLVRRIDAEFERRTLPDPGPVSDWAAGRRWWQRIRER